MFGSDPYVLLLLIVLPLVGAGAILVTPGSNLRAIRIEATAAATVTMLLSVYVFLAYDQSAGGMQFERVWQWLAMPGPWQLGDLAITFHLGIDGIAAPMVLLTGIVLFTGVLVSWKIGQGEEGLETSQGLLRPLPGAAVRRVRRVRDAGHVLLFLLLRAGSAPYVPADRYLGKQLDVPDIQPHQGIRCDEADDLPGCGQCPDLGCDACHLRRRGPWNFQPPGSRTGDVL